MKMRRSSSKDRSRALHGAGLGDRIINRHAAPTSSALASRTALVGTIVLHTVVLTAKARAALGFRADIILLPSVDAGVTSKMSRCGK